MLDIAVLYGPSNSKLTGQLLQQLLRLQPKYGQDLFTLSDPLAGNLQELMDKVKPLAATLLAAAPGSHGDLMQEAAGLQPSLESWAPPASAAPGSSRTLPEVQAGSSSGSSLSWAGLAKEAAAADAAAAGPTAADIPLPSLAQAAAAAPKAAVDKRTGRVLGALPSPVRSLTKNIAYEMQFEYDDEYDDSFDDLIGPGNDGVCAVEVAGQAGAEKALQEAKQAALGIHGLGPGGNVPLAVLEDKQEAGGGSSTNPAGSGQPQQPRQAAGRGAGRGGGRGGGRNADAVTAAGDAAGDGRGRGRGSYHNKEQHKAAVGNHHRKDRAAAKQAKGMF
eukprot:gene4911-5155_t